MNILKTEKLNKKTLATQLAEILENAISDGVWKVGDRLPSEPELSETYGVSRNTLRAAIHYLVVSGVLDVRQGDGTYVKNRTAFDATMHKRVAAADITNIIEVRRLIEPDICAMAAQRRTKEELSILEEKHKDLVSSYRERRPDYIEKDIDFHLQVAKMCHNPLLSDMYRAVIQYYPLFLKDNFLSFAENQNISIYLHGDLLACIQNGDSHQARRLTAEMIENEAADLSIDPAAYTNAKEDLT